MKHGFQYNRHGVRQGNHSTMARVRGPKKDLHKTSGVFKPCFTEDEAETCDNSIRQSRTRPSSLDPAVEASEIGYDSYTGRMVLRT